MYVASLSISIGLAICIGLVLSSESSIPTVVDSAMPFLARLNVRRGVNLDGLQSATGDSPVHDIQSKCQILSALYDYWRSSTNLSQQNEQVGQRLSQLLDECSNPSFRASDIHESAIIFPGTKWCGQSTIAENINDLGIFNETDRCCRDHDFCNDIIQPGKSKHNLVNPHSTTRLNCDCDDTLRRCFRQVNSVISNTMGYIFFSMLQTQCFKLEHPTVGCKQWKRGSLRLYCVEYELDTSKAMKWQWFDQEPYF